MSFWVHCNICFRQPDHGTELRFYLTNCSHLFCEECIPQCKEQCKVCKFQCSTLLLSGKMPKEIEPMFTDPCETLHKLMKQISVAMEFQKSQQRRLTRHLREKVKSLKLQIEEAKMRMKQAQMLERENSQLKQQLQYLSAVSRKETPYRNMNPAPPKFGSPSDYPNPLPGASGRLLMRTPPSGGRMGTIVGRSHARQVPDMSFTTPSTVRRPIVTLFGSD